MADFNMVALRNAFNTSLTSNEDIEIKSYLEGYEQLCNFCTLMGTLFGFVSNDILSKMGVLRQLQTHDVDGHFKTMKMMVNFEKTSNLLRKSNYVSGSRTLLRLHRGLGFLLLFLTKVHNLNMDDGTTTAGHDAYQQSLASHHSWFIRNGAYVAMYSLPNKEGMLKKICYKNLEQCLEMFPEILNVMDKVYKCVQHFYEQNHLLDLP